MPGYTRKVKLLVALKLRMLVAGISIYNVKLFSGELKILDLSCMSNINFELIFFSNLILILCRALHFTSLSVFVCVFFPFKTTGAPA